MSEPVLSDSKPVLSGFLTKGELAAALGRHPRTLDRWAALREGPPQTRIGRQTLYKKSSVQKWLSARERA